jgi:hypothetical protein
LEKASGPVIQDIGCGDREMLVDRDKAIEACAKALEDFWGNGSTYEHCAAAIRQLTLEECRVEVDKAVLEQLRNDVIESLSAQVAELRKERDVQNKLVGEQAADLVKCHWQVVELRKDAERYRWLANRVLACDYGDSERNEIGWKIRHDLLIDNKGERQPVFIFGKSIDLAIDAAKESG